MDCLKLKLLKCVDLIGPLDYLGLNVNDYWENPCGGGHAGKRVIRILREQLA
jgi:hypothetical protein